jgi:hypothetical protein
MTKNVPTRPFQGPPKKQIWIFRYENYICHLATLASGWIMKNMEVSN